jgi:FixJ family two-component response regulator
MKTVLVVDDNEAVLGALRLLLQIHHLDVETVRTQSTRSRVCAPAASRS